MITSINHITLAVTNIDRSFLFYRDILGLNPLVKWHNGAYFLVDDFWFVLNVDASRIPSPCYTTMLLLSLVSNSRKHQNVFLNQVRKSLKQTLHLENPFIFLIPMAISLKFTSGIGERGLRPRKRI